MKRSLAGWVLVLVSVVSAVSSREVPAGVVNPGFEQGTGWSYSATSSYLAINRATSAKRSGSYGLRAESTVNWLSDIQYALATQTVSVKGNTQYVLSAWQKSATPLAQVSLRIRWYDTANTLLGTQQADFGDSTGANWQKRVLTATSPQTAASASVELIGVIYPWALRVLYLDDVDFVERQTFPSGYYGYPNDTSQPSDIYNHGGNIVLAYHNQCTNDQIRAYLDTAQQQGIKVILEVPCTAGTTYVTSDTMLLTSYVQTFRDHPALYGWYIADEPPLSADTVCQAGYNTIKLYSSKPIFICVASTGQWLTTFTDSCDVIMYDGYPCLVNEAEYYFLGKLYDYRSMVDDTWYLSYLANKGYWIVMQGYGRVSYYPDGHRLPTLGEARFMLYYAINRGAKGWLAWCYSLCRDSFAQASDPYPFNGIQWQDDVLNELSLEINTLAPALSTTRLSNLSVNRTEVCSSLWQDPNTGEYYILAVNNSSTVFNATFTVGLTGFTQAQPLFENRSAITVSGSQFSDGFEIYRVHVYKLLP